MWKKIIDFCAKHKGVVWLGCAVGPAIIAFKNRSRLIDLQKKVQNLDAKCGDTEWRVIELQRQNKELLEKALRETEGSAE